MTGLQRLQYVATIIKDEKDIMPASYGIDISDDGILEDMRGPFDLILQKIAEEYGVIVFEQKSFQVVQEDGTERFRTDYYIDTLPGYDAFYEQLMQNTQNAPKPSAHASRQGLLYDKEHAKVSYRNRHVSLSPASSKQAFLFMQVHQANGEVVETDGLVTDYAFAMHSTEPSARSFKDARIRVNQKLKSGFGFVEVIMYQDEQFWLNPELVVHDSRHSR